MDKPLCPLCKTKHYGNDHKLPDEVGEAVDLTERQLKMPKRAGGFSEEAEKKFEPAADKRKTGKKFDKVAYQRNLMRKRRAEGKA